MFLSFGYNSGHGENECMCFISESSFQKWVGTTVAVGWCHFMCISLLAVNKCDWPGFMQFYSLFLKQSPKNILG